MTMVGAAIRFLWLPVRDTLRWRWRRFNANRSGFRQIRARQLDRSESVKCASVTVARTPPGLQPAYASSRHGAHRTGAIFRHCKSPRAGVVFVFFYFFQRCTFRGQSREKKIIIFFHGPQPWSAPFVASEETVVENLIAKTTFFLLPTITQDLTTNCFIIRVLFYFPGRYPETIKTKLTFIKNQLFTSSFSLSLFILFA